MIALVPRRRRLALAPLALVGALAATLGRSSCAEELPIGRPAVVWDGHVYVAIWQDRLRDGDVLYVQRGDDAPTALLDRDVIVPKVAHGDDGFLVIAREPGKWYEGEGKIDAIPLDADAHPRGAIQRLAITQDRLCDGLVASGDRYFFGAIDEPNRHSEGFVNLYELDGDGALRGHPFITTPAAMCSLAASDDQLALATQSTDDGVQVWLFSLPDARRIGKITLPDSSGLRNPRIVPYRGGWAVGYQRWGESDRMRVAVIDARGAIASVRDLPAEVDAWSADLGAGARGLYVTWRADRRMHVLSLDDRARERDIASSGRASWPSAIAAGDRCAIAWTTGDGARLRIVEPPGC